MSAHRIRGRGQDCEGRSWRGEEGAACWSVKKVPKPRLPPCPDPRGTEYGSSEPLGPARRPGPVGAALDQAQPRWLPPRPPRPPPTPVPHGTSPPGQTPSPTLSALGGCWCQFALRFLCVSEHAACPQAVCSRPCQGDTYKGHCRCPGGPRPVEVVATPQWQAGRPAPKQTPTGDPTR